LESDIWTDPSFYSFLNVANSSTEEFNGLVPTSQVMKLFAVLNPNTSHAITYVPRQFMRNRPEKYFAYLHLYDSVFKLARNRLEKFFEEDSLAMTTASQENARKFMMQSIKNEHILQIISNRHLDSVILMCIYLGTRFDPKNQGIRMNSIAEIYKTHPHYMEDVIYVYVGTISNLPWTSTEDNSDRLL
jgi:hypothetical protein